MLNKLTKKYFMYQYLTTKEVVNQHFSGKTETKKEEIQKEILKEFVENMGKKLLGE